MDDLIKALKILKNYQKETDWPTGCTHDKLHVYDIDVASVSGEDVKKLKQLGFEPDEHGDDSFYSYRFGSA